MTTKFFYVKVKYVFFRGFKMKINGNLKMIVESKINSVAYLQKYNFETMEYTINSVGDMDNLFRYLIFKDLENDKINTLIEIIKSYTDRKYSFGNSMFRCVRLFNNYLGYIPDVKTFEQVLLNSLEIYNYIKDNKNSFYNLKVQNSFCDNLYTAFQIIEFKRRKDVPQQLRYLYENICYTLCLTHKKELEYIKLYKETKDISYRNALIEHYQRFIFERVVNYHNKYNLDLEELVDLGNRIVFNTIESYSLDSKCTLGSTIRNRFNRYIMYLVNNSSKEKNSYLIKNEVVEVKDEIEVMLEELEKVIDVKNLERLILNIAFSDREIYFLLYGYGLFGFKKLPWQEIAKNLGVSRAYVYENLKSRTMRKIKKAIILESLKAKNRELSREERLIIRDYKDSFETMQSNSIKRFFQEQGCLSDEEIFDIERELGYLLRKDAKARAILCKRYNRNDVLDNSLLATLIVGYASEFIPLTIEEYEYLFERIIPTIKRELENKRLSLDLVKKQC